MKPFILITAIVVLFAVLLRKRSRGMFESSVVNRIAEAIARAEGFYIPGSRAARNHNPGNMTKDLVGKAVGRDGIFVVYANDKDGWDNLRKQVSLFFSGSQIFNSAMTLLEVAKRYTDTQQREWAENVAAHLGVSINTKLSEVV